MDAWMDGWMAEYTCTHMLEKGGLFFCLYNLFLLSLGINHETLGGRCVVGLNYCTPTQQVAKEWMFWIVEAHKKPDYVLQICDPDDLQGSCFHPPP